MAESGLQIGVVATLARVSVDTIRYYERRRLLSGVARSRNGFRSFTADTVERIRFIKQAQGFGLSLDEIKIILTSAEGQVQCRRVHDLLKAKLADFDERIRVMRKFRRILAGQLVACQAELKRSGAAASCPVIVGVTGAAGKEKK